MFKDKKGTFNCIFKCILISYVLFFIKNCEQVITNHLIDNYPDILTKLYEILSSKPCLNWITFIVLVLISGNLIYCFCKRKNHTSFLFVALLVFILVSYRNRDVWDYVNLPFSRNFDYRHLFDLILIVFLFIVVIKSICCHVKIYTKKREEKIINPKYVGFVQDTPNSNYRDVGWNDYVNSIVDRLIAMNEIEESFAIGISGSWGSGKTTFMNNIDNSLCEKDFAKFNFKPWSCTNPDQIIKKFFDDLSNSFKDKDLKLSKILLSYAELASSIDSSSWVSKLSTIFKWKEKTTAPSLKEQVEELMLKQKRVVVFIDDLDRLEKDELYEVLRLIRVTANFKNLIYIIAYDSKYVEDLLAEKGIQNGRSFIKKIINVEISLPGYEGHHIPNLLFDQLSHLIKDEKLIELLKTAVFLKNKDSYVTSIYLTSFRDAKRFANVFALNYSQISTNKDISYINVTDFFLIELLHYSYPNIYYTLRDNPELLLAHEYRNNIYILKKQLSTKASEEEKQKVLSELNIHIKNLSEESLFLLQLLFVEYPKSKIKTIQNIDNYFEYFYYRNAEDKLSLDDFNKLFSATTDGEIEDVVKSWCENSIWLGPSISNRFKDFSTLELDEPKAKIYLSALMKFSRYITPGGLNQLMASQLKKSKFNNSIVSTITSFLIDEIKKEIPLNKNPFSWAMILKALYTAATEDANDIGWKDESLLSCNEIINLKKYSFEFWEKNDKFNSLFEFEKIFDNDSFINKYLKASVVLDSYDPMVEERRWYFLLGKDEFFGKLKCESSEVFKSYEEKLFGKANEMPDDFFYDIDEYGEYNWKTVENLFASKETYLEFMSKCVSGVDETIIKEHLQKIGIGESEYQKFQSKNIK